nr:unnamed protein product [Callosobruchus chinensis]
MSLVYRTPVNALEELKDRIRASCDSIRNTEGILQRVRDNMGKRAEACILQGGGIFNNLSSFYVLFSFTT